MTIRPVLVAAAALIVAAGCGRRSLVIPPYADPLAAEFGERGPDHWVAVFTTTKGDVTLEVTRELAPLGADRFYHLVKSGFYDGQRISRVRPKTFAQWGLHWDTGVIAAWKNSYIQDDPPRTKNSRGTIAFAFKDPNTRATQVYINLVDNALQDTQGFAPFGKVTRGMDIVDNWYDGYGENAGGGLRAGTQGPIEREGAAWLDKNFPLLDRIVRARITSIR